MTPRPSSTLAAAVVRCGRALPNALVVAALSLRAATASAEPPHAPPSTAVPDVELDWLQYGAAFTVETRAASGGVCPTGATVPCILNSGGGVAVRVGKRWQEERWYLGGVYGFSKHDAQNILNLAILQQLRAELRRYLGSGTRLTPYVPFGAGLAAYGNEWSVDTYGGVATVGIGIEYEVTREVFLGLSPSYRAFWFRSWRDKAGQERPGGLAHFVGLELTMEVRSIFERW